MNDEFRPVLGEVLPTMYNDDDDTTTTYREGFPFVVRDQANYAYWELSVTVLDDVARIMEEVELPGWENARTMADEAAALDCEDDDVDTEWIADAVSYPPDGIVIDWNGDAGTVTVSVAEGWEDAE